MTAWGRDVDPEKIPAYALRRDTETPAEAVARAIARRHGLGVWGLPLVDTYTPEGTIWRVTMGTDAGHGLFIPKASLLFRILRQPTTTTATT